MVQYRWWVVIAFMLAGCASAPDAPARDPQLVAPSELVTGERLNVSASGLASGEMVTLVAARDMEKWEQGEDGTWRPRRVALYAWGRFQADGRGRVDFNAAPAAGTWPNGDARGLLWSGYASGAPELGAVALGSIETPSGNAVELTLLRGETAIARTQVSLINAQPGVRVIRVAEPNLHGAFALPPAPGRYPVVVLLHGSEGGSIDGAEAQAARFASRGFAALAINYFARPHNAIEGVAPALVNIPIETIAAARAWLSRQSEADVERIALYGVSKGAEFAANAAARYDWIDAVVPCVGSDVVWEGDVEAAAPGQAPSSWTFDGQPLGYVPLYPLDWTRWPINTSRYEASLARLTGDQQQAAHIPVEGSRAAFLLIGADRDEVWASGRMMRTMANRLRARPEAGRVELAAYPFAGHQICGDGAFPIRLYSVQSPDPGAKDLTAEGLATVDAWERTIAFLRRELRE